MRKFEQMRNIISAVFNDGGAKQISSATVGNQDGTNQWSQTLIEAQDGARYLVKVIPVNKEARDAV